MKALNHKRILYILFYWFLSVLTTGHGFGQQSQAQSGMPAFRLLLTDGKIFSYKDLQPNKPAMLIYFAPECDHCKEYTHQLTAVMNNFKNTQIIMVSYFPLPKLQQFYKEFKLDQFKNVKLGTEGNAFVVPAYFKIETFPFTALFNKDRKVTDIFRKPPAMAVLYESVKKIQGL